MYRYRATPQKSIGRNDLTYGLLAEELIGIKWTAVAVIPDISCDCALVTHLAERCTHGQLAPFQMLDVVLDVLLLYPAQYPAPLFAGKDSCLHHFSLLALTMKYFCMCTYPNHGYSSRPPDK